MSDDESMGLTGEAPYVPGDVGREQEHSEHITWWKWMARS